MNNHRLDKTLNSNDTKATLEVLIGGLKLELDIVVVLISEVVILNIINVMNST